MPVPGQLPSFDQLPAVDGAPPQSAWWLFGRDDQVGLFNLQTPERIAEAAKLVRRGAMFPLNWDLELPSPPLYGRGGLRHTILGSGVSRDDVYDNFFPQASSQWDSLVHVGHPAHGFYNGVREEEVTGKPGTRGGIEHWARRGIAGRAVLLDVGRYLESQGRPIDCATDRRITVDELEACRRAQGVEIQAGDVLLIRTGWIEWYLQQDVRVRAGLANMATFRAPGLLAGEAMARYLWDLHVVASATDCPALEAWPPTPETGGFLHFYLIGLFGMAIGELWDLSKLAADCAADGRYDAFFTSAPLNKLGGVGSPPNAIAFK
ncbi:MAG: cyclase family protein [Chloroflexi bacterium]|nr:cyclase family protein [Chloroflexota bacterium]